MGWQTPGVVENGPECRALHQPEAEQSQGLSRNWRFSVAPMMDWTDEPQAIGFPQEFLA